MIIVYVQVDHLYGEVKNISLIPLRTNYIKAELENPVVDLSNLAKYTLLYDEEQKKYSLVYDEEKYEAILEKKKKELAVSEGKSKMEEMQFSMVLKYASDEDAYIMRYLYEAWEPDKDYEIGDRRIHGDILYKCRQTHTSEAQHTPDLVPALWNIIYPEDYGTMENPVIIPEEVSSMVYVKGRYYKEGETLYFMNRKGMEDGEQISLTYKPSQLVGQYFEIIE